MKGLLKKFFGLLAIIAVTVTALAFVLDGTILSSKYLNQAANRSNLYDNLATHLPDELSKQTSQPEAVKTSLSLFLTPDFVQTQLTGWFDQIEAYYKHDGPVPKLQLTDFATQAELYGVVLPPGPPFSAPLVWQDPGIKPIADRMILIKTFGALAAILLLLVVGMLGEGWGRYFGIAKTLLVAALVQGGLYLLAVASPGFLNSALSNQHTLQVFLGDFKPFLLLIGKDAGQSFGQIGVGLVIAAAAVMLLGLLAKVSSRVGHGKETAVRPDSDKRMGLH